LTDKQFDTLMKKALAPDENPPELNMPSPAAAKPKRLWPTLVAACLCLAVSAGVAVRYLPDFSVKENAAAPESVGDKDFMSTNNGDGYDPFDITADQSQNEGNNSLAPDQQKGDPSLPQAAPPLSQTYGSPLLIPYATAKEQSLIREAAESRLGAENLQYTLMGKTDRWFSVKVTNATDTVYLNLDRRSQRIATLEDMLKDESLAISSESKNFAEYGSKNYVNFDGELVIVE